MTAAWVVPALDELEERPARLGLGMERTPVEGSSPISGIACPRRAKYTVRLCRNDVRFLRGGAVPAPCSARRAPVQRAGDRPSPSPPHPAAEHGEHEPLKGLSVHPPGGPTHRLWVRLYVHRYAHLRAEGDSQLTVYENGETPMAPFVEMLLWTTFGGACIPVGAGLARIEHIRPQWLEEEFRHCVIAFGGGALIGAVALVLVPEGAERLPQPLAVAALMLAGGGAFMVVDRSQAKSNQATPQFTAMAADFLPESLALGGMFAANAEGAGLLALLIGLQNLPEGFNAWRELAAGQFNPRTTLGLMVLLASLGPVCGLIGWFWLADHDAILGAIMVFAAGGILYLTFQDIAPQSKLERHWVPPLGAVLGFALALLVQMMF